MALSGRWSTGAKVMDRPGCPLQPGQRKGNGTAHPHRQPQLCCLWHLGRELLREVTSGGKHRRLRLSGSWPQVSDPTEAQTLLALPAAAQHEKLPIATPTASPSIEPPLANRLQASSRAPRPGIGRRFQQEYRIRCCCLVQQISRGLPTHERWSPAA